MKVLLLSIFVVMFVSCDKGAKTPEGLLKMYVNDLTGSSSISKDYFEKYTTGKLWNSVVDLDEEDFKKFISMGKVKNAKVQVSNKNCVAQQCTLSYIVKYDTMENSKKTFKSEVKKVAILVKEGEIWKISEVSNIKTYIEASVPIDALNEEK
jgi:hypothetical protein